jgi:hypothetical protein
MSFGKATPTPSQITGRVWLGSNKHAGELDASFSTCLSVGSRAPRKRLSTIDYLHVPLLDNGPVAASDFSTCVEFVIAHLARMRRRFSFTATRGGTGVPRLSRPCSSYRDSSLAGTSHTHT